MNPGVDLHLAQAPYLGLRPFEVDEADIFFGRERQTDELLRRLSQTYFLPIVGPSGCGKSSLVRAGLLASLESGFIVEAGGRWRVLTMMPRDRPIEELANAILRRLSEPDESKLIALQAVLRSGPRGLIEALKEIRVAPGENLLLLVDQFEEIFRFRDQLASQSSADGVGPQDQKRKDEADAFVTLLLEAVKERAAYVVLTMRSDFLRDCSLFAGLPEAFNRSIYLTPRLDRDDLQSAIQEPARVLGGSLQPELVRQLINDARSNQDQLPLMQHVLMRMWSDVVQKRPDAPPELTLEDYGRVGALSKALCQDADDAFEKELTPEQQRIAEVMFKALCVRGSSDRDTRAPARLDHVAKVAEVKWEEVVPVVEVFRGAGRYFLSPRSGPLAPDTVLDITHESLIRNWKRLSQWVEEEALSAETYQRLVRDAVDWKEGGDFLSPIRLSSLNAWEKRFHPTEPWSQRYGGQFALAMEYLQASRKQREKEAQDAALAKQKLYLKENAIKKLGIALGVAVLIVGWAIYQTIRASHQANLAKQQTVFAKQQAMFANQQTAVADANYGSALFIKAQLEWRSQKPLSAWPYAVAVPSHKKDFVFVNDPPEPAIRYYRQISHRSEVAALAIDPDGKTLAVALNDGSVDLVDPQTGSVLKNFAPSPAAKRAAEALPSTGKRETRQLAFSPDGKLLYFLGREFGLEIRSLAEGKLLPVPEVFPNFPPAGTITSFAIDPNGAFALGLEDERLIFSPDGSAVWTTDALPAVSPSPSPESAPESTGKGADAATSKRAEGRSGLSHLAFSPDGKTIAGISGTERGLRLWEVDDGKVRHFEVELWKGASDPQAAVPSPLSTVLFSPAANDVLMLASPDGKICLARLQKESGARPEKSPPSASTITAPLNKKSSDQLSKSSSKKSPKTLSQSSPNPSATPPPEQSAEKTRWVEIIRNLPPPKFEEIESPTTSRSAPAENLPRAEGIAMAVLDSSEEAFCWVTSNGRLNAWWPQRSDQETDEATSQLFVKAHDNGATALVVNPSGCWLATGGGDGTKKEGDAGRTRIWKITTIEARARAEVQKMPSIRSVASAPSGKIIAVGKDAYGTRVLNDYIVQPFPGLAPGMTARWLYLSTDGNSLVVSSDNTMHIFDANTFHERTRIEGISLSHWGFNGPILAALKSEDDLHVTLWDASNGKQLGVIPAAETEMGDIMFGSTGRDQIAIATDKNRLGIWDIHDPAQPRKIRSMETGDTEIRFIAFAAAENIIAAATESTVATVTAQKVFVFDAKTAAQLLAISVPQVPSVMVFDPLGTLLALAFEDGSVRVWDCKNARERPAISGSEAFATALALTPDSHLVTGGSDGRVRVWDLEGKLAKIFPRRDWWPKSPDEAARFSGLVLSDLDVRLLTPKEEEKLQSGAPSIPLDEDRVGEYWRAVRDTTRDFATLKKTPELQPGAIEKADHLARWLETHKESSDVGTLARIEVAIERHQEFLLDLENSRRSRAELNYKSKNYEVALAAVTEAIELETARTGPSDPMDKTLTSSMASLLLLRGRILEAQHSPEAQKDFEKIVAGQSTGWGERDMKTLAQLYLALRDPANLGAAEEHCAELLQRYPDNSDFYYYRASVFAIRSASRGADGDARAKDITAAIALLTEGVKQEGSSLRKFVDSTPFLAPLAQDSRFKALLLEDEERTRKMSEAGAAKQY